MGEPIRRQTRNRRPAVPLGAVPPVRNQVRAVPLIVEQLDNGQLRFTSPSARGWCMVARSHTQILQALQGAFREVQQASYARWRGETYDLDAATDPVDGDPLAPPKPNRRARAHHPRTVGYGSGQRRPDTADPDAWSKDPDGTWVSPAGRRYPAGSWMANRVVARRAAAGLPT